MSSLAQPLDAGVKVNLFVLMKFNRMLGNYISEVAYAGNTAIDGCLFSL
ncbi:hypothetical protein [Microcoleus sp. FACHB-672]|nr:hypothetical protein [Microcoleus sp. FACHB-672]MBD2039134.1 hypothetical protein [Microcoleus sp. FACHB-672]